jgi:transcriptional regulator with XRE-family HTH domain
MTRLELRRQRKRLGLSLRQAAAQVHVAPRTWARWESGDRHLPETAAHLFCLENGIQYKDLDKAQVVRPQ